MKREYDIATVRKWLEVFLYRFFQISQFKRTAIPNSPKVSAGGSLSPRGDWRAPADGNAKPWLDELKAAFSDCGRIGLATNGTETIQLSPDLDQPESCCTAGTLPPERTLCVKYLQVRGNSVDQAFHRLIVGAELCRAFVCCFFFVVLWVLFGRTGGYAGSASCRRGLR